MRNIAAQSSPWRNLKHFFAARSVSPYDHISQPSGVGGAQGSLEP
jgi:hypothetical protein